MYQSYPIPGCKNAEYNIQLLNEEVRHNTFYELRACPKLIKNNSYRGLARVDYYIVCTEGLGPSYIQLIMLHF